MPRKPLTYLWPGWPGLAVPGFWVVYILYVLAAGGLRSPAALLVALWPVVPLYLGSCLLAAWGRRGRPASLVALLVVGLLLAGADLAVKAYIEARLPYHQPQPLLPGLLAIDRVYNEYGTMLRLPGLKPFVTALSVLLVPISVLGYRYYRAHERPQVWGDAAFVGLFAGALAKAGDLLARRLIVDYLHIPGLPIADLADVYLIWLGAGCALAASLCYPGAWPDPRPWLARIARRLRGK